MLGDNADLVCAVAKLYIADGAHVADVTYGKGAFWRKTDTSRFRLLGSDLYPSNLECVKADFRALPYGDGSLDVVVLDPPYIHSPGHHMTDKRYNNKHTDDAWRIETASTHGMYHRDIMSEFYGKGMREAKRVLRDGGRLWVKCKDQIESALQCWSHIEIYAIATAELTLYAKDLFVLVPTSMTKTDAWVNQYHARKTHSYLWIFEKPELRSGRRFR